MSIPPMDYLFLAFAREQVQVLRERGDNTVVAWLFPDGPHITNRLWIKVPLLRGVERATSVDDLDLDLWMDAGRAASAATVDFSGRIYEVNDFPRRVNDPRAIRNSFTFVTAPQDISGDEVHPVNDLVNTIAPGLQQPWRGNVIVLMHGLTIEKSIVNIQDRYWDAVPLMISKVLRERLG
ncbi:hypothetical protein B0H11DRAFT_2260133 [Mycena galericulata]|nr:hypothetical protein B0H11DRAFT_2260133 [Mycena galericulata]